MLLGANKRAMMITPPLQFFLEPIRGNIRTHRTGSDVSSKILDFILQLIP